MSVTEVASALGEWSLKLADNTPLYLLNKLGYFGHIAITPGRIDPEDYGDTLLKSARYVGVNYGRGFGSDNKTLKGTGMAVWLGDSDDKGYTIEEPIVFTDSTFTAAFTALIPPSLQPGNIAPLPGLYNDTVTFKSRRKAMDYLCGLYNAEWRVNGDGTVDAGLISDLYVSDPKAAVIRNRDGLEMDYKALKGLAKLDSDVSDFTTRVLLLAEGQEASTVTATADINPALNPYKDLFGNPVTWTRIVSETATSTDNAPARAQLQLNRFTSPKDSLTLSTAQFDVKGDVSAGDWLWVYDADALLVDEDNEIEFHQEKIYPLKLRLFQLSWPITDRMGVLFRTDDGEWLDLTDYVIPESGETSLTVGGYNRSLTGQGTAPGDSPGSRPTVDTTVPDVVVWDLPFSQSTYQSDSGETKAQIVLEWSQPLNVGGSIIMDGALYEIRWRTSATGVYDITHTDLSIFRHAALTGTQASPIPYTQGPWQSTQVGFDNNQFLLQDLTPGIPYEFQIRAVDSATPPNVGEWSSNQSIQTRPDTTAPSTPAGCETVAGSRNAIQIVHTLGKASGGTFNLESDLNHFKVHVGFSADYIPVNSSPLEGGTLAGKVAANQGMLRGGIPIVATFQLDDVPDQTRYIKVVAVDNYGNESGPSVAVTQNAELIDSAFISELTVSKVSAGTIFADWIQAATMATGVTGARVAMAWYGIEAYNVNNIRTFYVNSMTGEVSILGTFTASNDTASVQLTPGGGILPTPGIIFLADNSTKPGIAFATPDGATSLPTSVNIRGSLNGSDDAGMLVVRDDYAALAYWSRGAAVPGFPNGTYQTLGGSAVMASGSARVGMENLGVAAGGAALMTTAFARLAYENSGGVAGGYFLAQDADAKMAINEGGADKNIVYLDPSGAIRAIAGSSGVRGYMEIAADSSNVWLQLNDFSGNAWGFTYQGSLGIARQSCAVEADVVSQTSAAYRPIRASAFPVGSSVEIKKDFESLREEPLEILRKSGGPLMYAYDGDRPDEAKHVGLLAEMLPDWLLTPRKSDEEHGDSLLPNSETVDVATLASLAIAALLQLDAEVDELRAELGKPQRVRHSNKKLVADAKAGKIKRKK